MINVEGITKKFDDFLALDNVTCNIAEGCIYGMVGSNGAGKSTFLRVLSGIYKPDQGYAFIDGANVLNNPYAKENIVFIADELYFLPGANMDKMAKFYASIYDHFSFEKYEKLLSIFKLDRKKTIATFSKGMKRQAAIIMALSSRAKYMFFDETFDGLDPVIRNLVKKLIYSDVEEYKTTTIITSHSLRELEDICDHLALLHKGGMVLDSDIIELKTHQFKVQIAFSESFSEDKFSELDITRYRQEGSVANMIVNGDRDETLDKLNQMNPILIDLLPLTLEEVFTYEMEALGYSFEHVLEDDHETEKDI